MKKYSSLALLLGLFVGATFAADPSYSFVPASGTQLRLGCNYLFNVRLQAGAQNYNGFDASVLFLPAQLMVSHSSVNTPFTQSTFGYLTGVSSDIYRVGGALPGGQKSTTDVNAATFTLKSANTLVTTTDLHFTTRTGGTISFGPATTADGATVNGFDVSSADILASASDATYTFVPLPCVDDTDAPIITNIVPSNGSKYIASNATISYLTYDWRGPASVAGTLPMGMNNTSHYWYQGLATTIGNYTTADTTVDNQEGINAAALRAVVTCTSCVGSPSRTLSGTDLVVTAWNGDGTHNQWTWNSQRRGYSVSFPAPFAYEVEKQVTVSLQSVDNPNTLGQIHTGTSVFSFNAASAPVFSLVSPTNTQTFVSPKFTPVKVFVSDDWAGVNTGSVKITIPAIYSGGQLIYTGYTYSGSELSFVLSGGAIGLGNSGSYEVSFSPKWSFPSSTGVVLTGFVLDLAGNTGTFNGSFTTRPDCSYFGCSEVLNVNILGGIYAGITQFTGTLLVATGTNPLSPYPLLTGVNHDIVDCGKNITGVVLTGAIQIKDSLGTVLNGVVYTGRKLYITGLDFQINADGVVTVN